MGKQLRYIAGMLTVLLTIGIFSGCGNPSAGKKPLTKIDIAIDNNTVAHVLASLPKFAGFYEEEGLDVNINVANRSADALSALTSGKVIMAGGGATAPLNLIEGGNDLVIIGGLMTQGGALFTQPGREDEWKNITQQTVQGKKIGVTRAQSADIAFREALVKKGIDLKSVEFVELGDCPTIIEAVKKGTVDAGIVFMTFRETAEQQGLKLGLHIDEQAPGFICCRVTTTREALQAHRADFVKLLRAQIKAYRLYRTDQEKTVATAKKWVQIDEKVLRSQLYTYGHLGLDPNPAKDKIEDFYDGMKLIGYAKGTVDIDDHIDTSVFKEALDSLLAEEPEDPSFLELKQEFDASEAASQASHKS